MSDALPVEAGLEMFTTDADGNDVPTALGKMALTILKGYETRSLESFLTMEEGLSLQGWRYDSARQIFKRTLNAEQADLMLRELNDLGIAAESRPQEGHVQLQILPSTLKAHPAYAAFRKEYDALEKFRLEHGIY